MRGLLAVYRCRCDRAAATLLLLLSRSMHVMGGDGFVEISLDEDPALKRGGWVWGLWEREREDWWEAGRNCLLVRYEASCGGVWRSRLVKESGLNEE
eukprot:scaffold282588_cov46-Attheya_sp.AAC.3